MPKKILIVDDHGALRYVLAFDLKKAGYTTIEASNGENGLKIADSETPDLIIMDMMMPGINGIQATKLLKQNDKTKDIPVIMLTARSSRGEVMEAIKSGVAHYVVKPYQFKEIHQKVIDLIGKSD